MALEMGYFCVCCNKEQSSKFKFILFLLLTNVVSGYAFDINLMNGFTVPLSENHSPVPSIFSEVNDIF